jgi:PAS domain S-box-containing protein
MARKQIPRQNKSYLEQYHGPLFDDIATVICTVNLKGIITYTNKHTEKITGYTVKELVGKRFFNIIAPESRNKVKDAFRKLKIGRKIRPYELVILDRDGTHIYLKVSSSPIKHNGRVIGMLGVATDITTHKKNVDYLTKMFKELSLFCEISKDLTSIVDISILFSKILMHLSKTFGYERAGILMIDEITNELTIRASTKPLSKTRTTRKIKFGQGLTGHAAKTGKYCLANDITKNAKYIPFDKKTQSELAVPLKLGDRVIGIINIESYQKNKFDDDDVRILNLIANQAAIAIENSRLYESLEESYLDTIKALVSAMEAKDHYTRGHSERVRKYAMKIAKALKLNKMQIKELSHAGYLHDIGKIGITDYLLGKIEPLTKDEYETIKKHPDIGHSILKDIKSLAATCEIIRCEHERYDGNGYPNGLKKTSIPLGARIVAVADAYDAMTTDRPYRKAIPKKQAINRLRQNAGSQFDPKIVKAFLTTLKKK